MTFRGLFLKACLGMGLVWGSVSIAEACSFRSGGLFAPTLERWEQHPGPAQKGGEGDYWEPVPTPIVEVISVERGKEPAGSSCDDAGVIVLGVTLPDTSSYDIGEFGFYVRHLKGDMPDAIFPSVPLAGMREGDRVEMLFAWLDGAPTQQISLDLEVEVFLVTNGLDIGKSTIVKIQAPAG